MLLQTTNDNPISCLESFLNWLLLDGNLLLSNLELKTKYGSCIKARIDFAIISKTNELNYINKHGFLIIQVWENRIDAYHIKYENEEKEIIEFRVNKDYLLRDELI